MRRLTLCISAAMCIEPGAAWSSKWVNSTEKSELTGDISFYWMLAAENETPGSLGIYKNAILHAACRNNETVLLFDFHDYMGSGGQHLRYKIDGQKVQTLGVDSSEGGDIIGLWRGQGVRFLKSLAKASRLVVSAKPYNEGAVEAVFDVSGASEVIESLGKQCSWK